MNKTGTSYAAFALLGILMISQAYADDNKSVALVNGVSITQDMVDLRVKMAEAQGATDSPDLRKQVREELINLELLKQEAQKAGLDKNPDVILQNEIAQKSILAGAYLQDYQKTHPVSDDEMKQAYDSYKVAVGKDEYKVSHILVDTEDEAKAIIAELGKKGSKFDKIAKEKSKDAGSAENGGSLGWAAPSSFVPPFASALLSLKKGEYTREPVKTQFGWHVIRLEDTRPARIPSFDDLKPQIMQKLQQQGLQQLISDLRGKAKIE